MVSGSGYGPPGAKGKRARRSTQGGFVPHPTSSGDFICNKHGYLLTGKAVRTCPAGCSIKPQGGWPTGIPKNGDADQ